MTARELIKLLLEHDDLDDEVVVYEGVDAVPLTHVDILRSQRRPTSRPTSTLALCGRR